MRLAHVRERHAPAGAPWRLAAALDDGRLARPRAGPASRDRRQPKLEHDAALFRQPITTLDDHLLAGFGSLPSATRRRVRSRRRRGRRRDARAGRAIRFGPPVLSPPSFRDWLRLRAARRDDVGRRGGEIPEAWYRLAVFYFSNVSEIRGPDDPVWAPRGSTELDYEIEIGRAHRYAGAEPVRRSRPRRRSAATRSSTTGRRATCSATRRRSGSARRRARTSRPRSGRGWSRPMSSRTRASGRRLRPRDDGRPSTGPRRRAVAGRTSSTAFARARGACLGRRHAAARRVAGSGTVGPAACSRSATRRSVDI